MKKFTLLESNQSDYIAFAGDSATFEEFLQKVKENGLEGELEVDELKKVYIENKPKTKEEGLSTYGDDAYFVAPNRAKMKKEDIIKAIKAVLAEEITQIDPTNPTKSKQELKDKARKQNKLTPELERAINSAPPKEVFDLEEDDHQDPNDESDMAKTQLYATAKYAIELLKMIQDGTQLDAWVQSKITKAADYIDSVKHYMEGEMYLAGTTEEPMQEDLSDPEITTLGLQNHLVRLNQELKYYLKKGGEADLRYAEMLKKDIADARAELDRRLSKKEVKEAKKATKMYYHVIEDVDGEKGWQGAYDTQEEAQKQADKLQDMFPRSFFYVEAYDSASEPNDITLEGAKKKLDPVGHEDKDVDNDGKENTESDKYIMNKRVKIGQAIAQYKKK